MQIQIELANRLKLIHYAKLNQGVIVGPKNKVHQPVFVIGMPRSGTTFLYNLLSQDTQRFRAPRIWEFVDPTPPLNPLKMDDYWRVTPQYPSLGFFAYLAQRVLVSHPLGESIRGMLLFKS